TVSDAPPPGPGVDAPAPVLSRDRTAPVPPPFKAVKFSDGSVAIDEGRPWSMRKYRSSSRSLGTPAVPRSAWFNPVGGEHAPDPEISDPADAPDPEKQYHPRPSSLPDIPGWWMVLVLLGVAILLGVLAFAGVFESSLGVIMLAALVLAFWGVIVVG